VGSDGALDLIDEPGRRVIEPVVLHGTHETTWVTACSP